MSTPPTPHLSVDVEVLRRNVEAMAAFARDAGLALRPHVKTHKCVEVARLQEEAGLAGVTVATIGEAEVFVQAGFDDVFIAYPLWLDEGKAARLTAVTRRARVRIGVDSVEGARNTAARLGEAAGRLEVLVELDSGHHRSGVVPARAGEVAAGARDAGLRVVGVFTFPGHSYAPGSGAADAAADEDAALAAGAEAVRAAGIEPAVVSGGSTPSIAHSAGGARTELRPGVYVFGDAQQWELGACRREDIALSVRATVVSHAGGRAVLDAGSKILGADKAAWATGFGRLLDHPDARIVICSEHHTVADLGGAPLPELGSVVRVVPNHACNAVNLVDELTTTDGDTWLVAARGANA